MKDEILKSVALDVTYKCNFRCLHCFNSSGEHHINRDELTDEQIINVATQIAGLNVETMCFCGGETLLRRDAICQATKKIREKNQNINVNMVSNGYLMSQEVAKELKKSGVSLVQISLDGAKKDSYEWLRNMQGSYERAINAIRCLIAEGFQVGVAFTPVRRNIDEIEEAIELCAELGVSSFRVQPIMELGRARKIKDMFLDEKQYFKLSSKLKKFMNQYYGQMAIEWGDPVLHIVAARNNKVRVNFFNITAYGDIGISPYLPVSFGNVKKHPLEEYINNGLLDVWNNFEFIKDLTESINSATRLDVSKVNDNIPAIFTGNDFVIDLIEDDCQKKDLEFGKKRVSE